MNPIANARRLLLLAVLLPAFFFAPHSSATSSSTPPTFFPGEVWTDTSGKSINAHGGGHLCCFTTAFIIGMANSRKVRTGRRAPIVPGGTRVVAMGVSCYSSTNLCDWKFEGLALPAETKDRSHDLHTTKVIERPKGHLQSHHEEVRHVDAH